MGFLWSLVCLAVTWAGEELRKGGAGDHLRGKGRLPEKYRMCFILQPLLVDRRTETALVVEKLITEIMGSIEPCID